MRSPEEIKEEISNMAYLDKRVSYLPLMLEIMCNIAITLDKISKEMNNEE